MADSKEKTAAPDIKIEARNKKGERADQLSANEKLAIEFVSFLIKKHYNAPNDLSQALVESLDIISRVARGTVEPSIIPTVNAALVRIASSDRVIEVLEETRSRRERSAPADVSYH